MVANGRQSGFTVAEMIVALVVLSLFMTLFFQLYMVSESQRLSVVRRAAASDIAMTNLKKITNKTLIPAGTAGCDNVTNGVGNPNNMLLNPALNPATGGSTIATNVSGNTPTWGTAGISVESLTGTYLLPSTTQVLKVLYPKGCNNAMPAQVTSTISYGSVTITRSTYVN
jgi:prepilin-type N-terminal cleavage/methylation domain-containing protein